METTKVKDRKGGRDRENIHTVKGKKPSIRRNLQTKIPKHMTITNTIIDLRIKSLPKKKCK